MNQSKNHSALVSLMTLLTPEQAAEILQISAATLQKWRSTGENNLPFVKIGKTPRYRQEDLKVFIDKNIKGLGA